MASQIVLNEKQSTYGGPYGFYTVTLTPSSRTQNTVTVKCDVSAHLQFPSSFIGYAVTCGIYIGGKWTDFVIYEGGGTLDNGKAWMGTDPRTASATITVDGLSVTQTEIKSIKFRALVDPPQGPQLDETGCADLTIDMFGGVCRVRSGGSYKAAIPYVKSGGSWKMALPYVKSGNSWKIGV